MRRPRLFARLTRSAHLRRCGVLLSPRDIGIQPGERCRTDDAICGDAGIGLKLAHDVGACGGVTIADRRADAGRDVGVLAEPVGQDLVHELDRATLSVPLGTALPFRRQRVGVVADRGRAHRAQPALGAPLTNRVGQARAVRRSVSHGALKSRPASPRYMFIVLLVIEFFAVACASTAAASATTPGQDMRLTRRDQRADRPVARGPLEPEQPRSRAGSGTGRWPLCGVGLRVLGLRHGGPLIHSAIVPAFRCADGWAFGQGKRERAGKALGVAVVGGGRSRLAAARPSISIRTPKATLAQDEERASVGCRAFPARAFSVARPDRKTESEPFGEHPRRRPPPRSREMKASIACTR